MTKSEGTSELVVGTAGHIDHGKSSLVRALTGIDPDRLTEEKSRGMTIDLGFASFTLPSGRVISFVDVPGHERFVSNMLAGAGGVDGCLLVIAADEGVMPQTREHLEILDLLGIHRGFVVLTKVDLIDEEMHQLVREDVSKVLAGTALASNRVLSVSTMSGEGLEDVIDALEALVGGTCAQPEAGYPRLPIDRVFTINGFGTVVTGTSSGGRFETGQDVEVFPGGARGRIRGLQSHGRPVRSVDPGRRTAVNLSGIDQASLVRGDVLSLPKMLRASRRADALIRVLSSAPKSLKAMDLLSFHVGAAEATARVFPLESLQIEPGQSGWAQLRFDRPLAMWRLQRGVLRQMSPSRTVAGVQVMHLAPRRRAREEETVRLADLRSADLRQVILALVSDRGLTSHDLGTLLSIAPDQLDHLLACLRREGRLEMIGGKFITADEATALHDRILRTVAEFHSIYPLRPGITREELRSSTRISTARLVDLIDSLVCRGELKTDKTRVALPNHRAGARAEGGEDAAGLRNLAAALCDSGLMPAAIKELQRRFNVSDEGLRYLVESGVLVKVERDIFVAAATYEKMTEAVAGLIASEGRVTVAQIRDRLGVSRKYALAYAEHLDARHVTRRVGDERIPGREFHAHRV